MRENYNDDDDDNNKMNIYDSNNGNDDDDSNNNNDGFIPRAPFHVKRAHCAEQAQNTQVYNTFISYIDFL